MKVFLKSLCMVVHKMLTTALTRLFGKRIYCVLEGLELVVHDAVANYSRKATLDILLGLSMSPVLFTSQMCYYINVRRKYNSAHHSKPATKIRRKVLRGEKKKKVDKQVAIEGKLNTSVSSTSPFHLP